MTTDLPSAPYPADTMAKGWRFELDHERIEQSDTWALTPPDLRPWLLMLWMTSWKQTPCGTLPNEDVLIAARIGMPPKTFAKVRAALLRGWWLAADGRLYHNTVAERVQAMLTTKNAEKTRKAEYRKRIAAGQHAPSATVPGLSHGTDEGQMPDASGTDPGKDATGTGTGTSNGSSLRSEPPPPKPEKAGKGYTEEFERVWLAYPSRVGQSKADAFKAWVARLADGATVAEMAEGANRYAAYCEANHTEPRFVKHAATFFGPDRHYLNDWTLPPPRPVAGFTSTSSKHQGAAAAIFRTSQPAGDFIDV